MKYTLSVFFFISSILNSFASCQEKKKIILISDSTVTTQEIDFENMLHPMDAFTAFTFSKSEWSYNQPIGLTPGWMWWGLSDRITTEIDIQSWLGGVPSINFRFALIPFRKSYGLAYELMYQYLPKFINQFNEYNYMVAGRQGNHFYHHLNLSYSCLPKTFFHLSFGFSYTENLSIENSERDEFYGKKFIDLFSPDMSISIDYRLSGRTSFNFSSSYGNTFVYMDNIPRKIQCMLGTRYKPFVKIKYGILNTLHIEFALLYMNFPDAKENIISPYGYIYWQWKRKK